jgi:drug/metabolite transporter (DMT)-like permease
MDHDHEHRRGGGAYASLSLAVLFWGLSFVATKVALETFPVFTLVFVRFALASIFFLVLMAVTGFPRFTRREHLQVFLIAFFEPGLYFVFETIGLQHTSAPETSLIIATIPIVVLVLAFFLLGEPVKVSTLSGIGLSLLGIAVLIFGGERFQWVLQGRLLGNLLIFGAVLSASMYIVLARKLARTRSAIEITSLQTLYGALFFFVPFVLEVPDLHWHTISFRSFSALGYLTLFATIAAFLCYNHALTRVPASHASVFVNGIPVVTAAGAWIILEEHLTMIQSFGGLLVLFGVFLSNFPGKRKGRTSRSR